MDVEGTITTSKVGRHKTKEYLYINLTGDWLEQLGVSEGDRVGVVKNNEGNLELRGLKVTAEFIE